jgi:hypothetical protein
MNRHGEQPLPLYGLADSFVGERLIGGTGWDVSEVLHRSVATPGELSVTVFRRTTAQRLREDKRVAISAELARESVATALVLPSWRKGDDDPFEIAARVANDEDAWKAREITVDGEMVIAHERDYRGTWLIYFLTPTLILHVFAPVALRPDAVRLRQLRPDEVAPRQRQPDSDRVSPSLRKPL